MANDKTPNSARSIADKQYLAKILFTKEKVDQKVVAQRVGISEKTMSKWVNDFGWKNVRRRLILSKEEQLNNFYEQLEEMNESFKRRDVGKRFGDSKEYDALSKLTACIANLETELNLSSKMEAGMQFIRFVQKAGLTAEEIINITNLWDDFMQTNK